MTPTGAKETRTPVSKPAKVIPCPTHTLCHPTLVVTQLSDISPPFSPIRHHKRSIDSSPTGAKRVNNSNQGRTPVPSVDSYELKLWQLVPDSLRPVLKDTAASPQSPVGSPPAQEQHQRQSPLDTTDAVKSEPASLMSAPQTPAARSSVCDPDSPDSQATVELITTPSTSTSKRRRNHSPSQFEQSKRLNRRASLGQTPTRKRTLIDPYNSSPEHNPFTFEREMDNPFTNDFDAPQRDSRLPLWGQQHPRTEPTTPTRPRTRCRSWEPETIEESPVIQVRLEQQSTPPRIPLFGRRRGQWTDRESSEYHGRLISTPQEPRLVRTDGEKFSTMGLDSKSPPGSPSSRVKYSRSPNHSQDGKRTLVVETPERPSGPESIRWSPSLHTPLQKRRSIGSRKGANESMLRSLRGLPGSSLPEDGPGPTAELPGWTTSFETPPRKAIKRDKRLSDEQVTTGISPSGTPVSTPIRTPADLPIKSTPMRRGSLHGSASLGGSEMNNDIQGWMASFETPPRKARAQSLDGLNSPDDDATSANRSKEISENVLAKLRGYPVLARSQDIEGKKANRGRKSLTSSDFPPRAAPNAQRHLKKQANQRVLDGLRGLPAVSLNAFERPMSPSSQEGSFYSATSELVGDDDTYQTDSFYKSLSPVVGNEEECPATQSPIERIRARDRVEFPELDSELRNEASFMPSVPENVPMTLPSSLLHELEQPSQVLGSPEIHTPIMPGSPSEAYDAVTGSAIDQALQGRSDRASEVSRHRNLAELQEHQQGDGVGGADMDEVEHAIVQWSQRSRRLAKDSSRVMPEQTGSLSISQDFNPDLFKWEPFSMSSPVGEGDHTLDVYERRHRSKTPQAAHPHTVEATSEDDFENIPFSQLDDGFNTVPGATQAPALVQNVPTVGTIDETVDEDDQHGGEGRSRLGTNAIKIADQDWDVARRPPTGQGETEMPIVFGGFTTGSRKALAPLSDAAKKRWSNFFDDEDDDIQQGGRGMNGAQSAVSRRPMLLGPNSPRPPEAPLIQGGFTTAGKKALPPISLEAQKRASRLFADDDEAMPEQQGLSSAAEIPPSSTFATSRRSLPGMAGQSRAASSQSYENKPAADDVFDRYSSLLFGNDAEGSGLRQSTSERAPIPPTMSGFSSGSGKALAPLSKGKLEAWSKRLSEGPVEADQATPRATTPGIGGAEPEVFQGFVSYKTNAPVRISKAAGARAYSLLELEDVPAATVMDGSPGRSAFLRHPLKPGSGFSSAAANNVPGTAATPMQPQQQLRPPMISNNMNNLKRKSLRASSSLSSKPALPGALKPLTKAKLPPFKPPTPMMKTPQQQITKSSSGTHLDGQQDVSSAKSAVPPGRKSIGKSLHPNARATIVAHPPPAVPTDKIGKFVQPTYRVLFDLEVRGERDGLKAALGPPKQYSAEGLIDMNIHQDAIEMTLTKAHDYVFEGGWGSQNALEELIARGAKTELLSPAWVSNHYGLVVWKLACYARSWPAELSKLFCSSKVVDQLAYRYEREINRAERPALRKIVEGDDTAARHMVLCIASLDRSKVNAADSGGGEVIVAKVTDGWYLLPATLDPCLMRAVERGKLRVGSKIHVCRAKLSGAEGGMAILEATRDDAVSLVLQANQTRLAKWDARLGMQRSPMVWTRRLGDIVPDAGLVPGLEVIVLRKYPVVYLETLEDGTKVKRTIREEDKAVEAHREKLQKRFQEIVEEVEREMGIAKSSDGSGGDRTAVEEEIQARVDGELKGAGQRNVTALFVIKVGNIVVDDGKGKVRQQQEGLVSFWHADHAPYQEGLRIKLTSLIAKKPSREHGMEDMVQLTATRMTTMHTIPVIDPDVLLLSGYQPRQITPCSEIEGLPLGSEIDLAVIILAIGEGISQSFPRKHLIVTDGTKRLILLDHQLSSASSSSSSLPGWMKVQSKVLIANARYKRHDRKLDLDVVSTLLSYSQVTMAAPGDSHISNDNSSVAGMGGWPAYAQMARKGLHELVTVVSADQGERGEGAAVEQEEGILELMAKANMILESMQPSV